MAPDTNIRWLPSTQLATPPGGPQSQYRWPPEALILTTDPPKIQLTISSSFLIPLTLSLACWCQTENRGIRPETPQSIERTPGRKEERDKPAIGWLAPARPSPGGPMAHDGL